MRRGRQYVAADGVVADEGGAGDALPGGSRGEREALAVLRIEALRVADPVAYAAAMDLLDDLEQRVREQKR